MIPYPCRPPLKKQGLVVQLSLSGKDLVASSVELEAETKPVFVSRTELQLCQNKQT